MDPNKAAISWSAGKDSCLALLRAREAGLVVDTFVTMCDADGTSTSHVLPPALIAAQVAALGGDWRRVDVPAGAYAVCFADTLQSLRAAGHTRMVFGDIDLQAHRDWLEPVCRAAGIAPVFPLWGAQRGALAQEVVARGIRARLVAVDTQRLDAGFAGADYDAALLARLPPGVCPCGEDGEFHTFVWDAPGFAAPLALLPAEPPRLVTSAPPLAPTVLALATPRLA